MNKSFFVLILVALAPSAMAQTTPQAPTGTPNRADSYFHFSLARIYDGQGRYTESLDEYKKALDLDPKNSTLYSEMAQTYWKNKQVTQAVATANKAVELNRDNIDAHMLLSQIYWQALIQPNAKPS